MIRYVCDRCGVTQDASVGIRGELSYPKEFTIIRHDDQEKHACSDQCAVKIKDRLDEKQEFIVEQ